MGKQTNNKLCTKILPQEVHEGNDSLPNFSSQYSLVGWTLETDRGCNKVTFPSIFAAIQWLGTGHQLPPSALTEPSRAAGISCGWQSPHLGPLQPVVWNQDYWGRWSRGDVSGIPPGQLVLLRFWQETRDHILKQIDEILTKNWSRRWQCIIQNKFICSPCMTSTSVGLLCEKNIHVVPRLCCHFQVLLWRLFACTWQASLSFHLLSLEIARKKKNMAKEHFAFVDIHLSTKRTMYGALKHIEERMQLHCLLMEYEKPVSITIWQRKISFWLSCTDPDNPDLCSFSNSYYLLLRSLNNMRFQYKQILQLKFQKHKSQRFWLWLPK